MYVYTQVPTLHMERQIDREPNEEYPTGPGLF